MKKRNWYVTPFGAVFFSVTILMILLNIYLEGHPELNSLPLTELLRYIIFGK